MVFAPELLTGTKNLATDNWLYLWVYLVFFNGLWVVIPLALMYQSWMAMTADTKRRKPSSTASRRSESPKPQNQRNDTVALAGGDQARKRKTRRKQY